MTPKSALIHFSIGAVKKIEPLTIGLVHATYKISAQSGDYVLQHLHPVLAAPGITADYAAVAARLRERGVDAQEVILARDGALLVPDGDRAWRLLRFVPGRVVSTVSSPRTARLCGEATAQFHTAMRGMSYRLQGAMKLHPYDTEKFLRDFARVARAYKKSDLYAPVASDVEFLLSHLPALQLPKSLPRQIVHGDLKITNFVFSEDGRRVVTLIDLDTCAKFSVLHELGDALRSWCGGAEDDPKNKFDARKYSAAMDGYVASGGRLAAREKKLLPRAVQLITLNLACRFLKDYFEDCYFGYDKARYSSRRAANLARARGQIALYKDCVKKFKRKG